MQKTEGVNIFEEVNDKSIIKVSHAKKSFKNVKVLEDVSIHCDKGEICGIVGRNGCGKTVLFKAICGFIKLDEGHIWIKGKEMHKEIDMLTTAGIIIEEPAFLRNKSGIKNLEFLYMIRNSKNRGHLRNILEKVGLDPSSKKHVGNYSMGMRQRLALAQAIMEEQDILILDEPMNGLDNEGVEEMRKLFLELKEEGKTILLASHNKEDIDILCDRVYEMDKGMISKMR